MNRGSYGPLTRYARLRSALAPGMPRHRLQRKPLVSDPGMHHGTCVKYVPWCLSGSLTSGGGENVPGIPGACATRNFAYLVRGPYRKMREKSQILEMKDLDDNIGPWSAMLRAILLDMILCNHYHAYLSCLCDEVVLFFFACAFVCTL